MKNHWFFICFEGGTNGVWGGPGKSGGGYFGEVHSRRGENRGIFAKCTPVRGLRGVPKPPGGGSH